MERHYYPAYCGLEEGHWWFRARRRILRSVLEQAGLWGRALRAVDVGCGTGCMVEFLREGMQVVGLDREIDALRFAARRGIAGLIQADAVVLPIRSASLDVVSAFDILEHLDDDRRALAEFNRVLRRGGHCVVSVPAFRSLWGEHDEINQHRRRYRREGLRRRLAEAGFRVVRCTYFNTLLFAPIAAVRIGRRLARLTPWAVSGRTARSDFALLPSRAANGLFERVMSLEAPLLERVNLPVGVSIVSVAQKPDP